MSEVNDWSAIDASNATLGSISLVEGVTTVDQINDIGRAIMGANKRQLGAVNIATSIASAATTNLNSTIGWYVNVTGTTTITGFGTMTAGTLRILRFSDILTLTYNATSLILLGGATITTAAGDVAFMISLGAGNWRCIYYQRDIVPAVTTVSNIYTPTIFNLVNIDSTSNPSGHYMRVGSQVMVSGEVVIDATVGGGTTTTIDISLPVASDLVATNDLTGTIMSTGSSGIIDANIASNRARASISSNASTTATYKFQFMYTVL